MVAGAIVQGTVSSNKAEGFLFLSCTIIYLELNYIPFTFIKSVDTS